MLQASAEVLILGFISAVRPATSQVAVIALLKAPAARRSLVAFALAGLAVSVAIGMIVVFGFDGVRVAAGGSTFSAVFNVVAGVAAIGFAAGVQRGRISRPRVPAGRGRGAEIADRLRNPSALTAAAAGVATHVPGLIYLVALNSIATAQPSAGGALAQVAAYNVLWFALPLAALVLAIRSPDRASEYLDLMTAFARRHQDTIIVVLFGAFGAYFTVKGIVELA